MVTVVDVTAVDPVSGREASLEVAAPRGHQGGRIVRTAVTAGTWLDSGEELTQEEKRRLGPVADALVRSLDR